MFFFNTIPGLILAGFLAGVISTLLFVWLPWVGAIIGVLIVVILLLIYFSFRNMTM
jgi:hypothetical protein